jgi:hypothetical protein
MIYGVCYRMSLRETGRRVRVRRTGRIPPDASVRHYDELDEDAQIALRELAGRPRTAPAIDDLKDGEFVKYTNYYQVRTR